MSPNKRIHCLSDGGLTYESAWGEAFRQPVLSETGIQITDYLYVWMLQGRKLDFNDRIDKGYSDEAPLDLDKLYVKVVGSHQYFNVPPHSPTMWKTVEVGSIVEIPATLDNLKRLLQLPLLDDNTVMMALKLINKWEHMLPLTAFTSIMMKNGAEPVKEGDVHRIPFSSTTTEVLQQRTDLSQSELMAVGMGVMPMNHPSLMHMVKLTEKKVYSEAVFFDAYCSSFGMYSQQMIAAWAISRVRRIALWMDMRVGKTAAASSAAKWAITTDKSADLMLIICPVTNMYDPWAPWLENEGFDVRILDGTSEADELLIDSFSDGGVHFSGGRRQKPVAYVINYERLHTRLPMMCEAWDMTRVFVAADETSAIKNPASNRSKAMHDLGILVGIDGYFVLLNGTPMEQGPQDLWSQMHCLDTYGVVWDRTFGGHSYHWLEQYEQGKWQVDPKKVMPFEVMITSGSIRYIRAEADQFAGKDKTFRHVTLAPTEQMYLQTERIANGLLETVNADGFKIQEEMTEVILRTYGFWREVACGYDKYREHDDGPYIRVRHELDPKLLWIQSFISANPTQPVVVYVEFNEQEQRLKEMLNGMNVKWSSTRPEMRKIYRQRVVQKVPVGIWKAIVAKFSGSTDEDISIAVQSVLVLPSAKDIIVPGFIRSNDEVVTYVKNRAYIDSGGKGPSYLRPVFTEEVMTYSDPGPLPPQLRAEQVAAFNRGESHVFILKWAQGRGISLARKEAVAKGVGVYPVIVSLAPCWSLGSWKQGSDRCVTTDERTGKNVNTMIYSLSIKGTLEQKILGALRDKENVASSLMRDIKREGFQSFVNDMLTDMKAAMGSSGNGDEDYFDAEEMHARIKLGVPPYSKLTETLVRNKAKIKPDISSAIKRKFGKVTNDSTIKYFGSLPEEIPENSLFNSDYELRKAWDLLMDRIEAAG